MQIYDIAENPKVKMLYLHKNSVKIGQISMSPLKKKFYDTSELSVLIEP